METGAPQTTPFWCFLCGWEDATSIKLIEGHLEVAECHEGKSRRLKDGQNGCQCNLLSADDLPKAEAAKIHENIRTCLQRKNLKKASVNLVEVPVLKKNPDSNQRPTKSVPTRPTSFGSTQGPKGFRQIWIERLEKFSRNWHTKQDIRESAALQSFSSLSCSSTPTGLSDSHGNGNGGNGSSDRTAVATKSLNPEPEVGPDRYKTSSSKNGTAQLQKPKSKRKGIPQRTDPNKNLIVDYVMKKPAHKTILQPAAVFHPDGKISESPELEPLASTGTLQWLDNKEKAEEHQPYGPNQSLLVSVRYSDEDNGSLTGQETGTTSSSENNSQSGFMGLLDLVRCSTTPTLSSGELDLKSSGLVQESKAKDEDESGRIEVSSNCLTAKNFLADFESGPLDDDSEFEREPEQLEADEDHRQQKFKSHSFAETLQPLATLADTRPRRQSALDKPHGLVLLDDPSSRMSSNRSPLKCKFCGKVFFVEERLFDHIRWKHNSPSDKIDCEECSFEASDTAIAGQHHQLVHLAPRVVIKSFENLGQLYDLVQAAAGESLDTDKLSKDGQVPKSGGLNCSQCGKLTKDSKALDNHIRNVHPDADDKGHFCPKCNASLKNKRSLKKHLATVHSSVISQCKFCVKQCKDIYAYKSHLQRAHSVFFKNIRAEPFLQIIRESSISLNTEDLKSGHDEGSGNSPHEGSFTIHDDVEDEDEAEVEEVVSAENKMSDKFFEQGPLKCNGIWSDVVLFLSEDFNLADCLENYSLETFDDFDELNYSESGANDKCSQNNNDVSTLINSKRLPNTHSGDIAALEDLGTAVAPKRVANQVDSEASQSLTAEEKNAKERLEMRLQSLTTMEKNLDDLLEIIEADGTA